VLGVLIEFTNSAMPIRWLMLSLGYMLVKYFQFLHELGGTGILGHVNKKHLMKHPKLLKSYSSKKKEKTKATKNKTMPL